MTLDSGYWEARWQQGQTGWDIGSVSTPIKSYVDKIRNKDLKVLIPGAGNSYEAEYMFKSGFRDLTIVDFAATPLKNLQKRLPGFPPSQLLNTDFFLLEGQYDLIIEQTFFCSLEPSMRMAYANKMNKLLSPGGRLVGVLFDIPLNADKPPFGGSREEYLGYFESLFTINTLERCTNSIPPRSGSELFIILEKYQNSST